MIQIQRAEQFTKAAERLRKERQSIRRHEPGLFEVTNKTKGHQYHVRIEARDGLTLEIQAMTARKIDAFTEGRNPLTPEQAATIAAGLAMTLQDTDEAARLLLLCFALTCERELFQREYMLMEIKARVSPYLAGFGELGQAEMRRQLETLKKEGAR